MYGFIPSGRIDFACRWADNIGWSFDNKACEQGKRVKLPHDRVTVRVGPPVSNAFAMKDVSRQDIAGRHGGLLQTPCFSGRCNSTLKNEAFLILDFKFQISDFDLKRSLLFILLLTAPLPSCQRQAANVAPSASGTKTVPMRVVT